MLDVQNTVLSNAEKTHTQNKSTFLGKPGSKIVVPAIDQISPCLEDEAAFCLSDWVNENENVIGMQEFLVTTSAYKVRNCTRLPLFGNLFF